MQAWAVFSARTAPPLLVASRRRTEGYLRRRHCRPITPDSWTAPDGTVLFLEPWSPDFSTWRGWLAEVRFGWRVWLVRFLVFFVLSGILVVSTALFIMWIAGTPLPPTIAN